MPTEANPPAEAPQTTVRFHLDEDGKTVMATVIPGRETLHMDQAWLDATLARSKLTGAVIHRAGFQQLHRMIADKQGGDIAIGDCSDADITLIISEDKMSAKLIIKTAHAGAPATLEHINEIITKSRIAESLIDRDAIKRLLDAAAIAKPGTTVQVIIAHGRPPIDGRASTFEALVEATNRHPAERADGSLDYRDLGAIPAVNEGDPLMRRHPPTNGKDGITVTGQTLHAKDGRERGFEKSKGAAPDPNDPDLMRAAITGQPIIHPRGISVDPILRVQDVNLRTGHIDYDGSLVVSGSISPGMHLKVAGDVLVHGMVESAELDIGGNLDVKMGISGQNDDQDEDHPPMRVRCTGNLNAGYIEHAELDIGGDLTVKSLLTHCKTRVKHQVSVGSPGQPRSGVVGGSLVAESLIRSQSLGTQAGIATHVSIFCPEETLSELQKNANTIAARDRELSKLLSEMVGLSKKKGKPGNAERIAKANARCAELKQDITLLKAKSGQLSGAVETAYAACIEVTGTVFPRVTVSIGNLSREIGQQLERVSFCRTGDNLQQERLDLSKKAAKKTN